VTRPEVTTDHNTDYQVYEDASLCGHENPDEDPKFECKHNGDCCGQGVECKTRVDFDAAMSHWEDNHVSGTGVDGDSVTICYLTPRGSYCEECSEENGDWISHRPRCLECEYWLEDDGTCQCETEAAS
jgi:hypothetical protein